MTFYNEPRVEINKSLTHWSDSTIYNYQFSPVQFLSVKGVQNPADYEIVFDNVGVATSYDTTIGKFPVVVPLPGKDVNFKIRNLSENKDVQFAFGELDGNDGMFTIDPNDANNTDIIFFLEEDDSGKLIYTWQVILNTQPPDGRNPMAGDTLHINVSKPFLKNDVYRFKMRTESESKKLAKSELDDIRVVPNPYIVTETWEPRNTYTNGRGAHELHFINLPKKCTIRIFNVNGDLIDKLEVDGQLTSQIEKDGFDDSQDRGVNNGMAIWDMLSSDNLEISYGIYLYHIDAPGIGEKTGTFAIIK